MGLPLYVAPVEPKLPPGRKCIGSRSRVGHRGPAGIRRNLQNRIHRTEVLEEAVNNRRRRDLRDRYDRHYSTFGATPQAAIDSGPSPERAIATAYIRSRNHPPYRRNPRTEPDQEEHDSFHDLMRERFGENWQLLDWPPSTGDINSSWWTVDPEDNIPGPPTAPQRLSRVTGTLQEAETDNTGRVGNVRRPRVPSSLRTSTFNGSPYEGGGRDATHTRRERWITRRTNLQLNTIRSARRPSQQASQMASSPPDYGLNGLGDRYRSPSPEVWDTLLATLTPDPQVPSAGSSFTSTAASHNAGRSHYMGRTLLSRRAPAEGVQVDQPCEPGRENSDHEDVDMNASSGTLSRHRITRVPLHGSFRAQATETNEPLRREHGINFISQHVALPTDIRRRTEARHTRLRSLSQGLNNGERARTYDGLALDAYQRRAEGIDRAILDHVSQNEVEPNAWTVFSVGTSVEEQRDDGASTAEEGIGSSVSTTNAISDPEELTGMHSIASHLARREDIPEEWWVQTGLSRTLANAHQINRHRRDSDGIMR